jgi:DNA-binding MarR family transcriptional regulator
MVVDESANVCLVVTTAARDAWKHFVGLLFDGELHERMHAACASLGVSPGVLKSLLHLDAAQGVPMRDLAERWACDASYVTSMADMLEQRGLAERRPHPTDRRVKTVRLTAAGLAAKQQALAILHEPPASFAVLTAAEQRQLRDLMTKVAAAEADRKAAAAG